MKPLVLALLALLALSCGRLGRISECRELTQTVNEHMAELEVVSKGKETPETFAKLSKGYAKLADEVAALPVAKGVASAHVAEYVTLMRSASKSSKETSQALEEGVRPDTPLKELDKISRKEKLSAQKLDAYCHAP
jgi:hypothetical protein